MVLLYINSFSSLRALIDSNAFSGGLKKQGIQKRFSSGLKKTTKILDSSAATTVAATSHSHHVPQLSSPARDSMTSSSSSSSSKLKKAKTFKETWNPEKEKSKIIPEKKPLKRVFDETVDSPDSIETSREPSSRSLPEAPLVSQGSHLSPLSPQPTSLQEPKISPIFGLPQVFQKNINNNNSHEISADSSFTLTPETGAIIVHQNPTLTIDPSYILPPSISVPLNSETGAIVPYKAPSVFEIKYETHIAKLPFKPLKAEQIIYNLHFKTTEPFLNKAVKQDPSALEQQISFGDIETLGGIMEEADFTNFSFQETKALVFRLTQLEPNEIIGLQDTLKDFKSEKILSFYDNVILNVLPQVLKNTNLSETSQKLILCSLFDSSQSTFKNIPHSIEGININMGLTNFWQFFALASTVEETCVPCAFGASIDGKTPDGLLLMEAHGEITKIIFDFTAFKGSAADTEFLNEFARKKAFQKLFHYINIEPVLVICDTPRILEERVCLQINSEIFIKEGLDKASPGKLVDIFFYFQYLAMAPTDTFVS